MSDSAQAFRAKTAAMFDLALGQVERIAKAYVVHLAGALIDATPGPNLQLPDTEYYAVGRLRGGWAFSLVHAGEAGRWDGGPLTEHGDDILALISAAVAAVALPGLCFLQNDVAYGHIVHEGLGRMPIARPWAALVAKEADQAAHAARLEVMGG